MPAGQRRVDLEQTASADPQLLPQGTARTFPRPYNMPLDIRASRSQKFEFHMQHVGSPPALQSPLQDKIIAPPSARPITVPLLDGAKSHSDLHNSAAIKALGKLSPGLELQAAVQSADQSSGGDMAVNLAGYRTLLSAVMRLQAGEHDVAQEFNMLPSLDFADKLAGAKQELAVSEREAGQLDVGQEFDVLSSSSPADKLAGANRQLSAVSEQQAERYAQALKLRVEQTVQRMPDSQTVSAAALRDAGSMQQSGPVKEREVIKPVQKPQLPIDVIVHWYDVWQLSDLTDGPPEAALQDLV